MNMLALALAAGLTGQWCGVREPAAFPDRCAWVKLDIGISHDLPAGRFPWADDAILQAVNEWADVVPFRFRLVPETRSDIAIRGKRIDGPKHVLAWSELPCLDFVQQVYDTSETREFWTRDAFTFVVKHEMGHALGLLHSGDPADVMYPFFSRNHPLSAADRANLVRTYRHVPKVVLPPFDAGLIRVGDTRTVQIPTGSLSADWTLQVLRTGMVQVSTWPVAPVVVSRDGRTVARGERTLSFLATPGRYQVEHEAGQWRASIATRYTR